MLKPLESIVQQGRSLGWSESEIQAKHEKLRDVLLNPSRSECGENVVEVFAHGQEALRVAEYQVAEANLSYWAVQIWSGTKESWLTQKHYSIPANACDRSLIRDRALRDAINWYPPVGEQVAEKWACVSVLPDNDLEAFFDTPDKLAEFWYDTKVFTESPWLIPEQVAKSFILHKNTTDTALRESIVSQLGVLTSRWEHQLKQYAVKTHRGMQIMQDHNNDADSSDEPALLVSITYESWNQEAKELGEPLDRGIEVERDTINVERLKRMARNYGITKASSSDPASAPYIWFQSVSPNEDRKFFEEGIETYYALHVHQLDGRELEPKDYQWVADTIGTKFDNPLELLEQRSTGVTLN